MYNTVLTAEKRGPQIVGAQIAGGYCIQLPKMNVGRFAISLSKRVFFKRAWQILKVLSRP